MTPAPLDTLAVVVAAWVAIAAGATACFNPVIPAVACGPDGECPPGRTCDEGTGLCEGPDTPGLDADPNQPDAVDANPNFDCESWSPRPVHFDPCDLPEPFGDLNVTGGIFFVDTTTGMVLSLMGTEIKTASVLLNIEGGPDVRVLSVDNLLIASTAGLFALGDFPLVIAAWSDIQIDGSLIAASDGESIGAGGDDSVACSDRAGTDGIGGADGGGGGGGGFGDLGGPGAGGHNSPGGGGDGGNAAFTPSNILAGCRGGDGGTGAGGDGGPGGGAVHLAARGSLTVAGQIDAGGGGGGGGGTPVAGGGGGGSGGYVGLEAPVVVIESSATVTANGGGGGGGADVSVPGANGEKATTSQSPASGGLGAGPLPAPSGGRGGSSTGPAGGAGQSPAPLSDGGGGGGGGSVGYIILVTPAGTINGLISPDAIERF